ncbi:uncharacterized protein LOC129752265 [Uranotaenia lowii]|uniref:uncharacterized protein LOC129752265 n=1 Tax=Uranotaenia lowii TaxID=190385 RepID=UPI00247A17DA|nr:uncharacterized protein LOC129752265 [Uranotaenia lowii]
MSRDDLRLLVKQERNLRSLMDNIQDFVNEYQAERDFVSLKYRMQKLDELYDKFIRVRENIEVITDDADMRVGLDCDGEQAAIDRAMRISEREEVNIRIIKDFENRFFEIKHSLGVLEAAQGDCGVSAQSPKPSAAVDSKPRVKLPELKLPTFSGRLPDWITFRDTFISMIHNNSHLSEIDKFAYLRTSLIGDALTEIASIDLTSANYHIAWQTLQGSYENKKLLVKSYLDVLFAVNSMKEESYEELNRVVKIFETTLMMLQKVDVQTEGMSTILQHMVCQLLDSATLHHWECHHNSKEVPTYRQLIEFLKSRCMVLRNISLGNSSPQEQRIHTRFQTVSHTGAQQKFSCPFCEESMHSVFKCAKFAEMKVSDRVELVKKRSLCLNCLSPGHIARFCIKGSCQSCGRGHHTLLHAGPPISQFCSEQLRVPQQVNPDNQTQISHNPSQSMDNLLSSNATDYPSTSHSSITPTNPKTFSNTVLLTTAVVMIEDGDGNTIPARALLDSGSQLCFMTEKIAQSLKFHRRQQYLPVEGIGQSNTCSIQSVLASIRSRYSNFRSKLKFNVLPKVTSDLPGKKIDIGSWNIPAGLNIADPNFQNPGSIDLILGAEVFYDLLLEGRHKLNDVGPTLQNTHLGWIVSGKVPKEFHVQRTKLEYDVTHKKKLLKPGSGCGHHIRTDYAIKSKPVSGNCLLLIRDNLAPSKRGKSCQPPDLDTPVVHRHFPITFHIAVVVQDHHHRASQQHRRILRSRWLEATASGKSLASSIVSGRPNQQRQTLFYDHVPETLISFRVDDPCPIVCGTKLQINRERARKPFLQRVNPLSEWASQPKSVS